MWLQALRLHRDELANDVKARTPTGPPHLPPSETKLRRFGVSVLCMSAPPAWLILEVHHDEATRLQTIRGRIIAPSGHVFPEITSDASRFHSDVQDLMAQRH